MSGVIVLPSEFLSAPIEIPCHIDGMVPKGSFVAIVAEAGAGKTFLTLSMALSMAARLPWFGREVDAKGVLYVCGEGYAGIPGRVLAWCAEHEFAPERLDQRIGFCRVPLDISDAEMLHRIRGELASAGIDADVIIIDTVSSNSPPGFNENETAHMKGYMDAARQLRDTMKCSVVFVHHMGHAGLRERGSSDFRGSMDVVMLVKADGDTRTLSSSKMRDLPTFEPVLFTLKPVDQSAVAVPSHTVAGASGRPGELPPSARNALATLIETGMGMPISNQAWFYATKLQKTAYYGAKKALLAGGYVLQDGKGFIPTGRGDQLLKITAEVREPFHGVRQEVRPRPLIKGGGANEPNTEVRELRNELRANQRHNGPGLEAVPWEVLDGAA